MTSNIFPSDLQAKKPFARFPLQGQMCFIAVDKTYYTILFVQKDTKLTVYSQNYM